MKPGSLLRVASSVCVAIILLMAAHTFIGCWGGRALAGRDGSILGSLETDHKPDFEWVEPNSGDFNCVIYNLPDIILPLTDNEFAILRKLDDGEFMLERIDDSLKPVWSLPIHAEKNGYQAAFFRSGTTICAIMTEFTENDSVKAVAYSVDAVTGKLLKSQTLDEHPGNIRWLSKMPTGFGPYSVSFSQDSSRILLSTNDYSGFDESIDADEKKVICNAMILDRGLNIQHRLILPAAASDKASNDHYYGVIPANDGSVIQVISRALDTIEVTRISSLDDARTISRYILPRSSSGELPFELAPDIVYRMTRDNDVIVAIGCQTPGRPRLTGIRLLKFRENGTPPALIADYMFTKETPIRMVDEKYFDQYQVHDLDISVSNRFLIFVEQIKHNPAKIYDSYSDNMLLPINNTHHGDRLMAAHVENLGYGPLLLFAFDSLANNKWGIALTKKQGMDSASGCPEAGHTHRVDHDSIMQIVYIDQKNDDLMSGRIGNTNGDIKQFGALLTLQGATYLRNYTTWLNDSTMVIASTKPFSSKGLILYKVRHSASSIGVE